MNPHTDEEEAHVSAQGDEAMRDDGTEGRPPTVKGRRSLRLGALVPRTRRGKVLGVLALLLIVGLAAGYGLLRPQAAASTTTTKQTLTISKTTLKSTVSASGTLQPERQADLTFSSSGKVTSVLVAVGDQVTAGQALAAIDPAALKIALQSASADLTAAKATLTDLQDSSTATTASVNAAAANVQVKTNAVTQARANLAAATMTAPFEGVVAEVNIAIGDTSGSSSAGSSGAGGSNASSGAGSASTSSTAVVLISKGTFNVSTSVSNSDVTSIKRGLQAVITPTGSSTPVYGTVSSVGVVASSSSGSSGGSTTFPVTIHVTGTHPELLAGSSVAVEIVTAQLTDVIAVPTQALTTANGTSTVVKLVNGAEVATPVTTGQVVGNRTVVTEGLEEGDQIVVANVRVASGAASARANSGNGNFQGFQGGSGGEPGQFAGGGAPNGNAQQQRYTGQNSGGTNR